MTHEGRAALAIAGLAVPDEFHTARLLLRPVRMQDAPAIFDGYAQDPEVVRYLTWRPHTSREQTESYVRACLDATTARTFMLVRRATDEIVGAFDLRRTGADRLECGYVLARVHWGAGLMTEALSELVRWSLRQPAIRRIGATVDVDNAASARVLEKAELHREALLRRWAIHPNRGAEPRDCFSYGRTR